MIEWFWMMLFVGVFYFERIVLFINMYWVLLFSLYLIDETEWFEELMKKGEGYEKCFECFSFHSSLCCLEYLTKRLFQSLCECFQQIHMNWSTPVTTCVGVLWNPPSFVFVDEMKCMREVGWLLNTNPTQRITLFPIILCVKVSVVILCELDLEIKIIKWRKWEIWFWREWEFEEMRESGNCNSYEWFELNWNCYLI